jgi:hypothetical protein
MLLLTRSVVVMATAEEFELWWKDIDNSLNKVVVIYHNN